MPIITGNTHSTIASDVTMGVPISVFINVDGTPILSNTLIEKINSGEYCYLHSRPLNSLQCISVGIFDFSFILLVNDGSVCVVCPTFHSDRYERVRDIGDVKGIFYNFILTESNAVYRLNKSVKTITQIELDLVFEGCKHIKKIVRSYAILVVYYEDSTVEVYRENRLTWELCSQCMLFLYSEGGIERTGGGKTVIDFMKMIEGLIVLYSDGSLKISTKYTVLKKTAYYMHVNFPQDTESPVQKAFSKKHHHKAIITIVRDKGIFLNYIKIGDTFENGKEFDCMCLHSEILRQIKDFPLRVTYIRLMQNTWMYVFEDGSFKLFDDQIYEQLGDIYPNPIHTYTLKLDCSESYI